MRALAWCSLVSMALAISSSAHAQVQPRACEWTGQPTLTELRVHSPPPVHISLVPLSGRRAVVSLVGIRLFDVHTIDDGAPLHGTTREAIPLAVSGTQTFDGIATVASGASIEELIPRRGVLRGTISIGPGARLERMTLRCESLGLASEIAAVAMPGPIAPGPRWLSRARIVRVRARPELEAPRVMLVMDDRGQTPFVERDRREGWVRIEARFERAIVAGWVRDTDVMPVR